MVTNKRTLRKKVRTKGFYPMIRSRHPSHNVLRRALPKQLFRSVIRLGSSTKMTDGRIELNSTEAIANSSNKLRMKRCFTENNVKTARWFRYHGGRFNEQGTKNIYDVSELPYPIVAKKAFGSRGNGNTKIDSVKEMNDYLRKNRMTDNIVFEVFLNFGREYRLHVTKNGYFYACRKVIRRDTPDDQKWFRNDKNSNWIREDGDNVALFDKPVNWDEIEKHSVMALNAVGLDFGAVDVKVQTSKNKQGNKRKTCDFFIIEINSAPSFGTVTEQKYKEILPELLLEKWKEVSQ